MLTALYNADSCLLKIFTGGVPNSVPFLMALQDLWKWINFDQIKILCK